MTVAVIATVTMGLAVWSHGVSVSANGNDGALDTSFGNSGNGTVTSDLAVLYEVINASAIQPDGKIVVAGKAYSAAPAYDDFVVARYNTDGSLDRDFGSSGFVITNIDNGTDVAHAVAIQPDGKIVVAGETYSSSDYQFALVRYNANGTLDTNFGSAGKVITDIAGSWDIIKALVIQPDGKIVAVGQSSSISTQDIAVARYNTDGTLDTDFGLAGKVITRVSSTATDIENATSVALQPDGKIVVGGYFADTRYDFILVRYESDGDVDSTFGTNGISRTRVTGTNDFIYSLALQSDGKIVVGGMTGPYMGGDFVLGRYLTDGNVDDSFGDSGFLLIDVNNTNDVLKAVKVQDDNKIVVVGRADNTVVGLRVLENGIVDSRFGTDGFTTISSSSSILVNTLSLQSDGKFIVGGVSARSTDDFFLARIISSVEMPAPVVSEPLTMAPSALQYRAANKNVTLRWRAVDGAASYVVTDTGGATKCSTTSTSCKVSRLRNGKQYSYMLYSVNADGVRSTTATQITARPGFVVKRTSLKANRSLKLSSIATTRSKGTKTWRVVSGKCRIQGIRLVATATRGSCRVRLSTAKSGAYPAMTTTIKISVER